MTQQDRSTLVVDVKPGDVLDIHGIATLEVLKKSGQAARLRVTASPDIRIKRKSAEEQKQG